MIINNAFVMNCNTVVLQALATALGVADTQLSIKVKKLRAIVGTKLANSATLSEQFSNDTLEHVTLLNDALSAAIDADIAQQARAAIDAADAAAHDAMRADADAMNAAYDTAHAAQAEPQAPHGKRDASKSAKAWLIELLSVAGAQYTLTELIELTGKTEVNIRTMLSDLRSAKYAGKYGVFNTKSTRVDNKTYYSKA